MIGNIDNKNLLDDDALENISGGAETARYDDRQLKDAGVMVRTTTGGKKEYSFRDSKNRVVMLSQSQAMSVGDVYSLTGGRKISDKELLDLIKQS
ncbi:MAG: hypothetical protein IJS86_00215 [Lachnospiraceae bacterium]|nr:hypothetical protein [Lachnospiraceae bacterium]